MIFTGLWMISPIFDAADAFLSNKKGSFVLEAILFYINELNFIFAYSPFKFVNMECLKLTLFNWFFILLMDF